MLVLATACGSDDDEGNGSTTDECEACAFDPLVEAVAAPSEQPTMDCGSVDHDDDAAAWTAAHDCVLAALAAETAVELRWTPQVIDSVHFTAIVGAVGESYAIAEIDWDCYQGDVMASQRPCTSVTALDDCIIVPGSICLQCTSDVDPTVLCE